MTSKLEQAARQALVALEDVMADFDGSWALADTAITALREALAEQVEQEPVAWMSPNKERLEFSRKDTVYGSHTIPLYAAPLAKQESPVLLAVRTKDLCNPLQDLTDDEILPIAKEIYKLEWVPDAAVRYFGLFARAVIAADREKNRG